MKGVRKTYDNCCTLSFLLVFLVLILLRPVFSINILSSTEYLTISGNGTLVSPGDVFELGFFRTTSSSRWYLGIWYKKVYFRTYVWVANRDNPLSRSIGTLRISNMNLVLLDHSNKSVWSTNLTRGNERSPVVAELLANGNFVMRDSNNNDASGFLWQSFDFPTDTLLPEMKLGYDLKTGLNRFLTAWRNSDDPSSGDYSYKLENRELPEFYLLKSGFQVHRSGPWNGVRFSGIPENQKLSYMVYNFTENSEEVAYTFRMTNNSIYSRLKVSSHGYLQRLTWTPTSIAWNLFWSSPVDIRCDLYKACGRNSYCDGNTSPLCNCIQGFMPSNVQRWYIGEAAGGCIRRTRLSCSGDGFTRMRRMKLPETTKAIVDRTIGVKECEKRCLSDCNCTAFANADIRNGGTGCVIWTGDLEDIRNYFADGQDLYVRLAPADLG
uniref:S-locus glycoprotein n=1 Tax=Brassica campestris TaxID=3711 RepID=Q2EMZ8_BRACM|nr:S-locus glycoprotein [Brassica rapa subsp. oleifera]